VNMCSTRVCIGKPRAGRLVNAIRPANAPMLAPNCSAIRLFVHSRRNPGAPSQDFLLSDPIVASHVTGNMPEQVIVPPLLRTRAAPQWQNCIGR